MRRNGKSRTLGDRIVKDAVLVLFTILLVLGGAVFISETAISQKEGGVIVDEAELRTLEREYISEIRDYLEQQGFADSGVSLTWVMEEDGSRSYDVVLHHKGIGKLTSAEREELFQRVETLAFQVSGCNFQVKLLV